MPTALRSLFVGLFLAALSACGGGDNTVVVYTALDDVYSRPILERFQAKTGIRVLATYDTEAQKTVGLYQRIIAERAKPQCDVFWNNEVSHTILLERQGLLEAYVSPQAAGISEYFKSKDGYWTGFAARARVLIYNTRIIEDPALRPISIFDLSSERWRGKGGLANPLFGTTASHVAALFAFLGPEVAKQKMMAIRANGTAILAGNAVVRDRVAAGELALGWTDTDDAHGALLDGAPVDIVYPDKEGIGTLLIPNSVAIIKGAPHPAAARKLVDYLLSAEVEAQLAKSRSAQLPLRPGVPPPATLPGVRELLAPMKVSVEDIADQMEAARDFIENEFLKEPPAPAATGP